MMQLFKGHIIAAIFVAVGLFTATAQAQWLSDYGYRKSLAINAGTGAGTGYQIQVALGESSGAASFDLHVEGNAQVFPDDIRFTDDDGVTELGHMLESITGTTPNRTAIYWVKVNDDLDSAQSIYVYYGKAGDSSASNGDTTFDFFDDFQGVAIDGSKWIIDNATGWSVSGGQLRGSNTSGRIRSQTPFSSGVILETAYDSNARPGNGNMAIGFYVASNNNFGWLNHNGTDYMRRDGSWVGISAPTTDPVVARVTARATQADLYVYRQSDASVVHDRPNNTVTVANEPIALGYRYDNQRGGQGYEAYWDWVRVRQYADTPPTIGAASAEEAGSGVSLANLAASNITNNTATFNARISVSDSVTANVFVDWGPVGGGTTSDVVGTWNDVSALDISFAASSLTPSTEYTYTFRATFGIETATASPNVNFLTYGAPAANNNGGATRIWPTSAILQGTLTAGAVAEAWFVLGDEIPATPEDPDAWDQRLSVGTVNQDLGFSMEVIELSQATTYFYSVYVETADFGSARSTETSFTTGTADSLYWDANSSTAGAGGTATGTWGSSNFWNTDGTGGAAGSFLTETSADDDLYLVAGPSASSGNGAFTQTVSGEQHGLSLNFQSSGVPTISGGTSITLGDGTAGAGGITVPRYAYATTNQGNPIINTPIVLKNSQAWTVDTARTMTVNGAASGSGPLTKAGAGALELFGSGSYEGGTTISGGVLEINSDASLGAAGTAITFDASATLRNEAGTIDLGSRPIALNNGAIATFYVARGDRTITEGAVTGDGGVTLQVSGGSSPKVFLNSTNNTFTGPVDIRSGSDNPSLYVNSLADSAAAITLRSNSAHLYYQSGAVVPLTLDNRPIVLNGGGSIDNQSSFPMTINTNVTSLGTGNRTFGLTGAGTLTGDIDQGTTTLGITISNWTFSGSNSYSGLTSINEGGAPQFLGTQALPAASKIRMPRSTSISLRTDDAGTVNYGNDIEFYARDTSTNVVTNYTINVSNNGGATAGSTIALGNMDLTTSDLRSNRQINVTGANGYRLEMGDVLLSPNNRGNRTGGGQRLNPTSTPLTISGAVKHDDGHTGAYPNAMNLYLGGTATGNLISGVIANADDNLAPLNIYKAETSDWTFSGINTYTGTTTVTAGTLLIEGSLHASSTVTVSGGAIGGTGTVGGTVNLTTNGGIDLLDGAVDTLTIGGGLNISGAAAANNLSFNLGTGANGTDTINVTGNVTMGTPGAGEITLVQLTGARIDAGTYDLIDATGTVPASSNFTLTTTAAFGNTFALTGTANKLQLVVTAPPPAPVTAFWTGGSDNNWSTLANWATDVTGGTPLPALPGFETNVNFYATGATRLATGGLDTDFDINSLTYVAAATSNTTISGASTLILEAGSGIGIMVNSPASGTPDHTISAAVALAANQEWAVESAADLTVNGVISDFGNGNGITKTGAGTLTLDASNTFSGPLVIDAGVLEAIFPGTGRSPDPLGDAPSDPSSLALGNGATLRVSIQNDRDDTMARGFTINGTADGASATLEINSINQTFLKGIHFSNTSSPGYGVADQTRTLILTGNRAPSGGNYNRNSANTLSANIADNGSGAVSLVKNGSGYWRIGGSCSYSGGTSINQGYLRVFGNNAFPTAGAMALADVAGARLVFDNYDQTIGSLSGGGSTGGNVELGSGTLTVGDATSTSYAGVISGSGDLIKQGTGTLTLTRSNTYLGATTINAGSLNVNGAIFSASSSVTVNTGGTLGGTGTVNAPVSVASGGAVAPGASTGVLTVDDDVTIAAGGTLAVEIDTAQTPNNDELAVSGALDITGATLNIQTAGVVSGVYVIATYGTLSGTFASTNVPDAIIDYNFAGGTAIAVTIRPAGTVIRIR